MARVVGVGAIMLYAHAPRELAAWYARALGIRTELDPTDGCYYGEVPHRETGTFTHFGIYPEAPGSPRQRGAAMVNYQVENLDAFLRHLRAEGIPIERTLDEPYGRFAYLRDPEGNPIELWEGTLPEMGSG